MALLCHFFRVCGCFVVFKVLDTIKRHIDDWRQVYIQVLLISTVTAVICGIAFVNKNVRVEQAKTLRNVEEVEQVAVLLAPIVNSFDLVSVRAIGNSLIANRFIGEVKILGKLDYEMYHSPPAPELETGNYIDVSAPIEYGFVKGKKERVGTLSVRLASANLWVLYWDAFKSASLIFTSICIIGFLTTLLYVKRSIARPLQQLQDAIELTLTLGQPIETETTKRGFIGKFQNQFNRMQGQLLRSQVELHEKSHALETSSNLMQEVLSTVRQSVRLYNPPHFVDLGDSSVAFPFPDSPKETLAEFRAYMRSIAEECQYEMSTTSGPESTSKFIQFDVDVAMPNRGWLNVKSIFLPAGRSALLITDITTAKEIEQSLQYAQKMEVVATLTSGIAHDFNNVLAIITGNLELIKQQADNSMEVSHNASQALNASRRAAAIVTSLLSFSKRKPERIMSVPVAQVLEEVATIAGTSVGAHFHLTTHCTTQAKVTLDIAILESSLINLIVNARDAMPDGGTIRLVARIATREECLMQNIRRDRPYVVISVVDEGTGVPVDLQDKITKSFFTTKAHGSGLGLAMIEGFVENSSGKLHFGRNDSKGMTFSIYLPCSLNSEAALVPAIDITPKVVVKGSGKTILLVEDEDVLLQVMTKMFTMSGFKCIPCACLTDVRTHFRSNEQIPDIVVTDLNLPDGTGRDLLGDDFKDLARIPKILLSGNMETGGMVVDSEGFEEVCLKPIETSTLISLINDILGAKVDGTIHSS